jgi:hypothetical protein
MLLPQDIADPARSLTASVAETSVAGVTEHFQAFSIRSVVQRAVKAVGTIGSNLCAAIHPVEEQDLKKDM